MNKSIKNNHKTMELWDSWSESHFNDVINKSILKKIEDNPASAFPKKVYSTMLNFLGTFKDKKICVPSSGDNVAVFAFHMLGGKVTSTDISANQINKASAIAKEKNWDIEFLCQDSMYLDDIENDKYDLVYTSNGVHVWISDLKTMYMNFNRILKDNGYFIFFDTHPISRPFIEENGDIVINKRYDDIELFEETHKYHWRIQDFINGIACNNFNILKMDEIYSEKGDLATHNYCYESEKEEIKDDYKKYDWKQNPRAALPQCLSIYSQKKYELG